jgi:hypothetical protein
MAFMVVVCIGSWCLHMKVAEIWLLGFHRRLHMFTEGSFSFMTHTILFFTDRNMLSVIEVFVLNNIQKVFFFKQNNNKPIHWFFEGFSRSGFISPSPSLLLPRWIPILSVLTPVWLDLQLRFWINSAPTRLPMFSSFSPATNVEDNQKMIKISKFVWIGKQ